MVRRGMAGAGSHEATVPPQHTRRESSTRKRERS